jgi:hypothetical protein
MKSRALFLLVALAGAASSSVVRESDTYDASSVRGSFISSISGVRAAGMGGAYTAIVDDVSAMAGNPGGLGQVDSLQMEVMHDAFANFDPVDGSYGLTDLSLTYLACAMPLGARIAAGVSIATFGYGEYELRDNYGALLGMDSARDFAARFCLAAPSIMAGEDSGSSGIFVEYVRDAAGGKFVGFGAGGVIYFPGPVSAGWSLEHIGPERDGYSLPAAIKLGAGYEEETSPVPLRLAADFGFPFVRREPWIAVGGEAEVFPVLALRAGYKWQADNQGLNGLSGASIGFGVKLGDLGFDYAFRPFGELMSSHRMGIIYRQAPWVRKVPPAKMPALGLGLAPAEAGQEPVDAKNRKKTKATRRSRGREDAKEVEKKEKLKNLLPPPREFQIPPLEQEKKGPGSTLLEPLPPVLGGK